MVWSYYIKARNTPLEETAKQINSNTTIVMCAVSVDYVDGSVMEAKEQKA